MMGQNERNNTEKEKSPAVGRTNPRPGRKLLFMAAAACLLVSLLVVKSNRQKSWKPTKISDIKDTYLVAQLGEGGIEPAGTTSQAKTLRAAAHAKASDLQGERVRIEGLSFCGNLIYAPCSRGERASIAIRPGPRLGSPNRFLLLLGKFLPALTASPVVKNGETVRVYGIYRAMGLEPTGDLRWCDWVEVEKLHVWDQTKGRWRNVTVMP